MVKTARKVIQLALALGGLTLTGATGCGDTDYFAVQVTVPSTISSGNLEQINSCEVMVSGAVSDSFGLHRTVCGPDVSYTSLEKDAMGDNILGTFEYGTTKTSGSLTFKILLRDGSGNTIGQGQADGQIHSGVVPLTLKVTDTSGL